MPKNISHRELVSRFRKLGFDGPYSGGRHLFMVKAGLKVRIPNPHGKDIPVFFSQRNIKAGRNIKERMGCLRQRLA